MKMFEGSMNGGEVSRALLSKVQIGGGGVSWWTPRVPCKSLQDRQFCN